MSRKPIPLAAAVEQRVGGLDESGGRAVADRVTFLTTPTWDFLDGFLERLQRSFHRPRASDRGFGLSKATLAGPR